MKNIESQEQQALMQWAKLQEGKYPELQLLHAIPNGGKRNVVTATILKKEGVKSGVPDLFLPVARTNYVSYEYSEVYHGLYIEMKAPKGVVSQNQLWWISKLREQGYKVAVCYGFEQAKRVIEEYLGKKLDKYTF